MGPPPTESLVPPVLLEKKDGVLGCKLAAKKLSSERIRYTYHISWEEDDASSGKGTASEPRSRMQPERIACHTIVYENYRGKIRRLEMDTKQAENMQMRDVVNELLEAINANPTLAKVYVYHSERGNSETCILENTWREKLVKDMPRDGNKINMTIDLVNHIEY